VRLEPTSCYAALVARDRRFDGRFVVGVTTTGIYCRPICPARTPAAARCRFFGHAAQAEAAGFRACFRCRPELAPASAPSAAASRLVAAALACIEAGALDEASVDALAEQLGVTARHLRRVMQEELGTTPVAVAQSMRCAVAKQLLQDGHTHLTQVALASGFGSVRRFNAVFAARYGRAPSDLLPSDRGGTRGDAGAGIVIRIGYRAPFAWSRALGYLRARAMAGVEHVDDLAYARVVVRQGAAGRIAVRDDPATCTLAVAIDPSLVGSTLAIAANVRRMFDTSCDPASLESLARDPSLAPRLAALPGLRIFGGYDGFEIAVRAVLGQQVTVAAATTLTSRVVAALATPLAEPIVFASGELTHRPLEPRALADADPDVIARIGMPRSRALALVGIGRAFAEGRIDLSPGADPRRAEAALCEVPGVGPWTASYIVLRATGDPDAFPADDLALRRVLDLTDRTALTRRAESWRPWRGYAAMLLWNEPRTP
jgi:AraC family transcriptional regulator of adaptative response / DNA-3-methyladenine glycosylase II